MDTGSADGVDATLPERGPDSAPMVAVARGAAGLLLAGPMDGLTDDEDMRDRVSGVAAA